ncbi:MAG: polysaccharide export protein [Syntrophaceae bacterium]|nr:polysaccharide export protein [Syntrophaceae bacterium]
MSKRLESKQIHGDPGAGRKTPPGEAIMRRTVILTLVCLLAAAAPAWAQGNAARAAAQEFASAFGPDYLIGPGDILEISVWKEEALTKQVVVLPDGKISFPLIGEVQAAGRTLADLKKELAAKLAKYAPKEEVNLEVKQVNSMLIYVIGRVNQPGRFALNTNVTVLQALSIAGGLNAFAKRNQIKIFRQEAGGTQILPFSYDEVTEGEKLRQNVILKRGDVVVVP